MNDALYSGDVTFARAHFDEIVERHTNAALIDNATGLVHSGADLSALIDTSGGSDDGYAQSGVNSVVNAWVYLGLRSAAALGRCVGRAADAAALNALAAALAAAFQVAMWDGTAICDGVCAATPHRAAHASFYALYSSVLDGAPYQAALLALLAGRTANDTLCPAARTPRSSSSAGSTARSTTTAARRTRRSRRARRTRGVCGACPAPRRPTWTTLTRKIPLLRTIM